MTRYSPILKKCMMICVISKSDEYSIFIQSDKIYYQKKEFQCVQLDMLILPRKKGHEVLMKIKADNNLKKIPVIMLTTSSYSKDIDFTYENGCNSYVKKPLEMEDFLHSHFQDRIFLVATINTPK